MALSPPKASSSPIPRTPHVSDPLLSPFLQPTFDPAVYLNSSLSTWASLADISSETQSLLTSLTAHSSRLTNTLTHLTDDIIRSGSRLAYQVDVLRGEAIGLADALGEGLKLDIGVFVPEEKLAADVADDDQRDDQEQDTPHRIDKTGAISKNGNEPAYMSHLHLLTHVRARLESVIQTFGSAMSWPPPPTESSSFISVSAPAPSQAQATSKAHAERLRSELADLVAANDEPAALAVVDQLAALLGVWKGTAEERPREKWVAELVRFVEEKVRERESLASPRKSGRNRAASRGATQEQPFIHGFYG
jgi:hypothetical protein